MTKKEIQTLITNTVNPAASTFSSTLTFDAYSKKQEHTLTADITAALAGSGNVEGSFITWIISGDGVHTLDFPVDWVMLGDRFNLFKVHEILFKYTQGVVVGVMTIIDDIPDIFPPVLNSAAIENATPSVLDLVFDEAVTITAAGWSISASGGAATVDSVASGSGTATPKLNLSRSISANETVTVSYNPATGATTDLLSNELATVTAQAVTNNVVVINLEVLFAGTTVDTAKGTLTNPDSANLTISQNNKLLFTRTTDVSISSSITNYYRTVNTYTRGTFTVLMNAETGFGVSLSSFQYRVDVNNDIAILRNATLTDGGMVTIRVRSGGTTTYSLLTAVPGSNRFMIEYNSSNQIRFYYYSSGWVLMGATQTVNIGAAGTIQLSTNSHVNDAAGDVFSFDSLYVTDRFFPTATP